MKAIARSSRVPEFHTPGTFWEMMQLDFDAACEQLRGTPNLHPRLRLYQIEANAAVKAAIAARKREPFLAMATGTVAQQAWLDRIREHLIANLSIDREDFDDLPVFARHGGWAAANRDFDGGLLHFLEEVNQAIAA